MQDTKKNSLKNIFKQKRLLPLFALSLLFLAIFAVILFVPQSLDNRNQAASRKCLPRPACLDSLPPCRLPEPVMGWCKSPTSASRPACRPRPDCLEYDPPCQVMPPKEGWCPSSSFSCQTCESENKRSLCLDKIRKTGFCTNQTDMAGDPNRVCVSCLLSGQNPTPLVESVSPNLAVSKGMGTDWFSGWAKENDVQVYFGEGLNFDTIVKPQIGKVAWNVPSFAQVIESYPHWKDKVDIVIYDYEKWTKTPSEEQNDPESTAINAQSFVDQRGKELIFGTSWRMAVQGLSADQIIAAQGKIDWDSYLDKDRVGKIVANVKNYGVNATGLRVEFPDAYIDFFNAISSYAISVNPNINLWPVLDARNQTAGEMNQMYQSFKGNTKGLIIMGTANETKVVEEFLQLIRK